MNAMGDNYDLNIKKESEVQKTLYSPGIVKDEETLVRLAFSGQCTKKGKLASFSLISVFDRISALSVLRCDFDDFIKDFKETEKGAKKKAEAQFIANVGEIRKMEDDKKNQLFLVLDIATKNKKTHAEIFTSLNHNKTGKNNKNRILKRLSRLFKKNYKTLIPLSS